MRQVNTQENLFSNELMVTSIDLRKNYKESVIILQIRNHVLILMTGIKMLSFRIIEKCKG